MTSMQDLLTERIYEASHLPELWAGVLEEIGRLIDAPFGFLMLGGFEGVRWTNAPGFDEVMSRMVREHWLARGTYARKISALCESRFVADQEAVKIEEFREEPIFRDFCRPAGLGFGATTMVTLATGEQVSIGWRRELGREPLGAGELDLLNRLRPALACALSISAQSRQRSMNAVVETLEAMGLPALILDSDRNVLAANALMKGLKHFVAWSAAEFLTFRDVAADAGLRNALMGCKTGEAGAVTTFLAKGIAGSACIARILSLPLCGCDVFAREAAVLALTPAEARRPPSEALLRSLFGMTPCEAKVARSLACGKSVIEIATQESVSTGTVRTHVRKVLEKTGSSRQIDAVALLVGMALAPTRDERAASEGGHF